jgi:hypothetical protein
MSYYEATSYGFFPCLFNSKVYSVVLFEKISCRWNFRNRTIVTKMTVFKMKAAIMKTAFKMLAPSPPPKACNRVGTEKAKIRISVKVARVV